MEFFEPWVEAMGDQNQFAQTIRAADIAVRNHEEGLTDLLRTEPGAAELRKAFSTPANVTRASEAAIGAAVNGGQETEAVLQLLHGLYEGPAVGADLPLHGGEGQVRT